MKTKREQHQKKSIPNQKSTKIPNICIHINKYLSFHRKCDGIAQMCSQKCPRSNHIKQEEHQIIQKKDLIKQIKLQKERKVELVTQYIRELEQVYEQLKKKLVEMFTKTKIELEKLCFNQQESTLIGLIEVEKLHILTCSNIHYLKNIEIDRRNIIKKAKQIINQFKKLNTYEPKDRQIQWRSKLEQILRIVQSNYIIMIDQQRSTHAKLYLQSENKSLKLEGEKKQIQKNLIQLKKKYNILKQQHKKIQQNEQKLQEQKQLKLNLKRGQDSKPNQTNTIAQQNILNKNIYLKTNSSKMINTNYNGFIQEKNKANQNQESNKDQRIKKKADRLEKTSEQIKSKPFNLIQFHPIDLKQALQVKIGKKSDNFMANSKPQIIPSVSELPPPKMSGFKNYITTFSQIHQNLSGLKQSDQQQPYVENKKNNKTQMPESAKSNTIGHQQVKQKQTFNNKVNNNQITSKGTVINQVFNGESPKRFSGDLLCNTKQKSNQQKKRNKTYEPTKESASGDKINKNEFKKSEENKKNDEQFGINDKNDVFGYNFALKGSQQQYTPTFNPIQQVKNESEQFHGKSFKKKSEMVAEEHQSQIKMHQKQSGH